jgi:hypothetical protein
MSAVVKPSKRRKSLRLIKKRCTEALVAPNIASRADFKVKITFTFSFLDVVKVFI